MQNLTEVENTLLGVAAGVIEVSLLQSANYWKNAAQQGLPWTINPATLYRGYLANVSNMGVATGFQFFANGYVKKAITGGKLRPLAPHEQLAAGFAAGFTSAVVCSPLELVMIQQQRKGGSMPGTMGSLIAAGPSTLFRGTFMTAMREGVYCAGYLGVAPAVREGFVESYGMSEDGARVPAAIAAGFFGCYLSHPFDTIKTCMQGDIERVQYKSTSETAAAIWRERGLRGMYSGVPWRLFRQIAAAFLLDKARVELAPFMFPSKFD